ncbi:MAG: 2-amino-4-hydroxy-6-hydroxymethyldihydropteridine diphosphokinase [Campylobacteraceae bacterium]|nr:2-amino-4-hydroxy-6-hydroxymethyldihydropteridine diphosphokinase [Campylobacteraceae bacterium]
MKRKKSSSFKYEALVGIGGNVGDVIKRFRRLIRYWQDCPHVKVFETSPILQNPAFGQVKQPDFLNAVARIQTSLSPQLFLKHLLHTEGRFGRVRLVPNGPRTLDLDLIFFEDFILQTKHLNLPHPGWKSRISVLVPLGMMQQRMKR